ncbi:hypothetical protein T09_9483 [Trichinella sp. T9]|nr:hypothetical protein T09_9483 [Trichinella sp. T9]
MLHNGDKKFDMLYCGVSISMDSSLSSQLQSHVSHIVKSFFTVGLAHLPKLNNECREMLTTLLKTSAVKGEKFSFLFKKFQFNCIVGCEDWWVRERFKALSSLLVIVFVNTMLTDLYVE